MVVEGQPQPAPPDHLLFSVKALRQWSTERTLASLENEDAQRPRPPLSVLEGGRGTGRHP